MKQLKKVIQLTSLLMLMLMSSVFTVQAESAKPVCVKAHTVYVYKTTSGVYGKDLYSGQFYIKNLASNAKITALRSSNSKIMAEKVNGLNAISISANYEECHELRPGMQSEISFKVKQNKKTYTLTCTVKIAAQKKSAFSSLKIGSNNLSLKSKTYGEMKIKNPNKTVKLTAKARSGYKISKIQIFYNNGTYKTIKNGQKVSLKRVTDINILYRHTKKPIYYKAPAKGFVSGQVPSPLYELTCIHLY